MLKFFIEPLLMIAGLGVTVGLMYAASILHEKHKKEDNE